MAVHFALRSRIRLDPDPPARRRAVELPPLTVPVAFYWAVMGALTWGVFTGALRIDGWAAEGTESWTADEWGAPEEAAGEGAPEETAAPLAAPEAPPPSEPPAPSEPALQASLPLPAPDLEAAPAADVDEPSGTTEPASAPEAPEAKVPSPAEEERPRRASAWSPPPDPFAPAAAAPATPTPPGASPSRDVAARPTDVSAPLPPVRSPAPEPPPGDDAPASGLPSCEAAAASASDTFDLSARSGSRAPDVTRDAYARILENGAYLSPCGVPASTRVGVCVAVKEGRAAGITVTLEPPSARVRACVERAVRSLRFPSSPRLDVTRTTFDAAR